MNLQKMYGGLYRASPTLEMRRLYIARMDAHVLFGDALVLGLASGPACLAACGPVLVPSLLAGEQGIAPNLRTVAIFLSTRLAGYLLFALVAWELGSLASLLVKPHPQVIGVVYVLMAAVLAWYAIAVRRNCASACATQKLVTIEGTAQEPGDVKKSIAGVALLGFLTGMNFCPPFVVAGIRAAQLGSLPAALLFFTAFFAGTSVWFIPFAGLGCVARSQALITVARMTMGLVALYYLSLGIYLLIGR
jgi:sulfite exporter TauE/SafE